MRVTNLFNDDETVLHFRKILKKKQVSRDSYLLLNDANESQDLLLHDLKASEEKSPLMENSHNSS